MFQYFNQNSLIILVFLIGLLIFFLPMRNVIYKVIFFSFSILILLILKSLFMPSYENIGQKEIDRILFLEKPVLVEFYSDTWIGCILSEPFVKRVEKNFGYKIMILRIDASSKSAPEYIEKFNFFATPSFILLNSSGESLWRQDAGILNYKALSKILEGL